jgi:hypothetical protein
VCTASVAVPPALRSEGFTELIGDIVLTCTGGSPTPVGTAIPTANITVSLGTQVTSRILGAFGTNNASEALLMIDEPGANLPSPVPGFGPSAPQSLCTNSSLGAGPGSVCAEYAQNAAAVNGGTIQVAVGSPNGTTAGANIFIGNVTSNQVTFQGVPILAPVSAGVQRIFRITNVRANVAGLGGGGLPGTTQLLASVSISGSTSLPVNNPTQIAGFIQSGLTVGFRNVNNSANLGSGGAAFNQCGPGNTSGNPLAAAVLQFQENFGTAFKTRVAPTATTNGQAAVVQNIPGTIYNSESGFVLPAGSFTPIGGIPTNVNAFGLADYGTRLKAVFTNVPAGVRLFVSVTNLASNTTNITTVSNAPSYAVLINGETTPDANGAAPVLAPTTSVNSNGTALYELQIAGGTATAVWEVINTVAATNETLNFGLWTQFTANPGNNSPPPGTATVNLSYAPTPPVAFSASAGSQASSTLTIPRFADTSTARNVLVIQICQTLLLFPFVTNASGFDTGIAIANTSTDPVGTGAQNGTCTLSWYDGTGKVPNTTSSNIATGTVYTALASSAAPGFTGYMMALCNFQYAHGFAYISDLGARNFAHGYLALVVTNGTVARPNAPAGEGLGH